MSEEMIDVLDAQGVPTGQVMTKGEIHRTGTLHRTVHIWIVTSQGDLVVQRRGPNMETFPNRWDISSAGHISAGESSLQGAIREMKEELGLIVDNHDLELLGIVQIESFYKNGTYIDREYQDVYLTQRNINLSQLTAQQSEVSGIKLISWIELQQLVEKKDPEVVPHTEEYHLLFSVLQQRFPNAHPR